jgi:hypothetical protein
MLSQMKNIPGMENFQSMISQLGLSGLGGLGGGSKVNLNNIENALSSTMKTAKTKERMNKKIEYNRNKQLNLINQQQPTNYEQLISDEQLDEIFKNDFKPENTKRKHKK